MMTRFYAQYRYGAVMNQALSLRLPYRCERLLWIELTDSSDDIDFSSL